MEPLNEEGIAVNLHIQNNKRNFLKNKKRITDAMNMNLDNNSLIIDANKAVEVASVVRASEQSEMNKARSMNARLKTTDRTSRLQKICVTAGSTIKNGASLAD